MQLIRGLWWLAGAGIALGAGAGLIALQNAVPVYASTASVLVSPVDGDPNLPTEAQLVRSTKTAVDARARVDGQSIGLPVVTALPGTSVLEIRLEAETPALARAGAQAYADAYLANRGGAARAAINAQIASLQVRLDDVNNQVGEVNTTIARMPTNSPDLTTLRTTASTLTTESATMTSRLNELRTTTVDPGRVIADADLPAAPARPLRWLYLSAGAVIGALLGLLAGLVRIRGARRVHRGGDLGRHGGIPVLADLDPDAVTIGTGPQHPSAQAFNRLRNEVVAALGQHDRILVVTGATPGAASMLVAANLAAAFARAESDVVLVGASVPELGPELSSTTLARIFDVADIPGLTDVLTGRTSLARAVQRAARSPRLRVVTPGGTASATGLLQSEGARAVLGALAAKIRYVVVEAPSTASGADAQSLASVADAALLVVETGRAQHAQVADAALQLDRVGTRLLGAVVVPRLRTSDVDPGRGRALEYNTEAWIGGSPSALDAPTSKLQQVPRAAPPPHDEPAPEPPVEPSPGPAVEPSPEPAVEAGPAPGRVRMPLHEKRRADRKTPTKRT